LSRRSERSVCGTPASLSGGDHDGVHTAATGDELDGDRYNGHRRDDAFVAGDNLFMETPDTLSTDVEAEELPDMIVPSDIRSFFKRANFF
jgi:hypothetical protein